MVTAPSPTNGMQAGAQRFRNRLIAPEVVSHVLAGVFELCANFERGVEGRLLLLR
jgi:hypothetical protein